jgi:capsular exopolysaccharide synthesis family protein
MANELIVLSNPKSTIAEDIRTTRTNLEFSLLDREKKVILITSSKKGEGKSFISSNLAVAFAQNNKKVLIIDCDLRLGRVNKIFGLHNKFGLSDLLLKYKTAKDIKEAIKETKIENVSIITRGAVPANPPELLGSERFAEILEKLKSSYDYIILDATPVLGLSDVIILSKLADKIAIVCKYNTTNLDELAETKKLLSNVQEKISGVVINKIPTNRSGYGYYHGYGYYGKDYTEE